MPSGFRLAIALLPFSMSLGGAPVQAATLSTFAFAGICTDCAGVGTGRLVLTDYTIGTTIMQSNFVSFRYDGSNLLAAFSITSSEDFYVSGRIDQSLPGPETVFLSGDDQVFTSALNGYWCIGSNCLADYGQSHVWSAADASATVPEPMTFALLGSGLLGLAVARRRF